MRKPNSMLILLALLAVYIPTYAQPAPAPPDHWVIVRIGVDGCPESTRVGTSNGRGVRCERNGKAQADAVCVSSGAVIEWRSTGGGNDSFSITEKNEATSLFNSSCAATTSPPNRVRCTVAATSGSHHYNIETSSCLLDPRILFN